MMLWQKNHQEICWGIRIAVRGNQAWKGTLGGQQGKPGTGRIL